jgi:hypothetical protein
MAKAMYAWRIVYRSDLWNPGTLQICYLIITLIIATLLFSFPLVLTKILEFLTLLTSNISHVDLYVGIGHIFPYKDYSQQKKGASTGKMRTNDKLEYLG